MEAPLDTPGHDPGQAPGLDWEELVAWLVHSHGTLAAVAERLAEERGHREDLESVERALRRLRGRGQKDGGTWGRRVLSAFGLPPDAVARVRWMGTYHSLFHELPTRLTLDLLYPWDRPPVRDTPARVWLLLARASLALRARDLPAAAEHLTQAAPSALAAGPAATVEHRLVRAFVASRTDREQVPHLLDEAEAALRELPTSEAEDVACWRARLVDQRAFQLNVRSSRPEDHTRAAALYAALPDTGAPPFARCRRLNGLAWSAFRLGQVDEAVAHARASAIIAGDAGSLRLRAMALNALASFRPDSDEGRDARARAAEIAARLEHLEIAWRARPRG